MDSSTRIALKLPRQSRQALGGSSGTAVLPTVHRESNMHMFYHMHSSHDPQALQSCLQSIERATCTCSITCTVLKIPQAEKSCFTVHRESNMRTFYHIHSSHDPPGREVMPTVHSNMYIQTYMKYIYICYIYIYVCVFSS